MLIVGSGRIGRETARLVEAFGADRRPRRHETPTSTRSSAQADVVSLHVPLTAETRHLIDARRLRLMKPTRSSDQHGARAGRRRGRARRGALRDGIIAGAGLDVYEREPEVTEALLGLENVVLAPHLGSATRDTRVAMGMLCVDAARAVLLEGRTPPNAVV